MTSKKVILDIDPGIDDAVALCVALAEPSLEIVAVTATGGVVGPLQATRNLQALLERIDPPRWPRMGAADPHQLLRADARDLHGRNGLGGVDLPYAEMANQYGSAHLMAGLIRKHPNDLTLISTGPMSNLASLLTLEPDMPSLVGEVIIAGGSVAVGGDITAAAEFNIYCDASAARDVLRTHLTKTLIPLDISRQLTFGYDLIEFVKARTSRTAQLLTQLLPEYYLARRQRLGVEDATFGDVTAVLLAAHPELFKTELMHVDVETSGELTHGATVCDRRSLAEGTHTAEVVTSVDVQSAREAVLNAIVRAV